MYVSDRLVFLQLQKTGSTHITKLLTGILGSGQLEKHARFPDEFPLADRPVLGSIRNPWDWYVSLWAFGCKRRGSLYVTLTSPEWLRMFLPADSKRTKEELAADAADWISCYQDAEDPVCFRRWLRKIHDPARRFELGEHYGRCPLSPEMGFYTYRYAYMFIRTLKNLYAPSLKTWDELRNCLNDGIFPGHIIHAEQLEDHLIQALAACGIPLTEHQILEIRAAGRTNASARVRPFAHYYDDASVELVGDRERYLIERFGYRAPILSANAPDTSGS